MNLRYQMNPLSTKGNWNIAKGKAKQMLARLIHDDLQFVEGKTDELVGRIQKRAAATRRYIERSADLTHDSGAGHR